MITLIIVLRHFSALHYIFPRRHLGRGPRNFSFPRLSGDPKQNRTFLLFLGICQTKNSTNKRKEEMRTLALFQKSSLSLWRRGRQLPYRIFSSGLCTDITTATPNIDEVHSSRVKIFDRHLKQKQVKSQNFSYYFFLF